MATVLRIRLADLLPVLAPGIRADATQNDLTQLKLTGFRVQPEVRPEIDEHEAIQRYLRGGSREDLLSAATLRRLDLLRQKGDVMLWETRP